MSNIININVNKTDLGLNNVDNTSDLNKPISTATQTALNGKEDIANKSTNTSLGTSDTLYPSQKAVKTYVDTAVSGVSLTLGETSTTAYRGDRGKTAYDHSLLTSGNPHNVTKSDVGLSNVQNTDTTNPANIVQTSSYRFVSDTEKSTWNNKQNALGFTPENIANKSTDVNLGTSDVLYPTQNAVKTYTDNILGNANALIYKGVIDCSTNPNYPSANAGELYIVSVAGKIGGASGVDVEAGDMLICNTDSTISGNQSTVGSYWNAIQKNIEGYVNGPAGSINNTLPVFDGTTGKLLKQGIITDNGSKIGVDITSPTAKFHINNLTSDASFLVEDSTNPDVTPFIIDNSGNVGIGTTNPTATLSVRSTAVPSGENIATFQVSDASGIFSIQNYSNSDSVFIPALVGNQASGANQIALNLTSYIYPADDTGTNPLMTFRSATNALTVVTTRPLFDFRNWNTSVMTIAANGNIGIGITAPSAKLEVNGDVKVSTILNATTDTDKFLVSDSGVVKYRTGAELLSDINGASKDLSLDRKTASYTLVAGDNNKLIEMNVATANNVTINNSVFTAGNQILVSQYGAGQVTFVAGSGVTLRSPSGKLKLTGQYSLATIICISATEFYISGDLTA